MKTKHLLSVCLAAIIAATGTVGFAGSSLKAPLSVTAADDTNDDWLHCEGSRIFDKDGNEVWLTGANWFGFNCSENCVHYLWSADVDDVLQEIADHGINIIRFPIATELLVSWMNGEPNPVSSVSANADPAFTINPDFCEADGKTLKNSMEIFDPDHRGCHAGRLLQPLDLQPHFQGDQALYAVELSALLLLRRKESRADGFSDRAVTA